MNWIPESNGEETPRKPKLCITSLKHVSVVKADTKMGVIWGIEGKQMYFDLAGSSTGYMFVRIYQPLYFRVELNIDIKIKYNFICKVNINLTYSRLLY